MPNDAPSPVHVSFTLEFKRNLRKLAKKYRNIKSDLQPILEKLEEGSKPGDRIQRIQHEVFKVRAKNSNASRKGKAAAIESSNMSKAKRRLSSSRCTRKPSKLIFL